MDSLSLVIFPGGSNWPLFVARDRGLFGAADLDIRMTLTPSSAFQMTSLTTGDCDVVLTAYDNVVACNEGVLEGTGEAEIVALSGYDRGFLKLVAAPGIRSVANLRGREIAVDGMANGFAFVLLELLANAGLAPADVRLVASGGVGERWKQLQEGRFAATLLLTPFDILAQAQGFVTLASAGAVLPHYQGNVIAANRAWASRSREILIRFIGTQIESLRWLMDRDNRAEAVAILCSQLPTLSPETAGQAYDAMTEPETGYQRDARADLAGMASVMALRRRYGPPPVRAVSPDHHFDLTFHDTACRSLD